MFSGCKAVTAFWLSFPVFQEKDRVRKLLQGAARLEFWETYDNTDPEISNGLMALNNLIREINKSAKQAPHTTAGMLPLHQLLQLQRIQTDMISRHLPCLQQLN